MSRKVKEPECFDGSEVIIARKLVGEYEFQLAGIEPRIKIRIWKEYKPNVKTYSFSYTQSHYIHTPKQIGPYVTSAPFGATERMALEKAVDGVTRFFKDAVAAGLKPSEKWLSEDEDFHTQM